MFYDLGVLEASCSGQEPDALLSQWRDLGYDVVAIEQQVTGRPPKDIRPGAGFARLRDAAMAKYTPEGGHNVLRITKRPVVTVLSPSRSR